MAERDFSENSYGIKSISEIYTEKLTIPPYQRPYKWSEQHTQQLLEDLFLHFEKKQPYRIGTLVLHKDEKGNENIVDGQQRITTLALLIHHLIEDRSEKSIADGFLSQKKYFHSESVYHLKKNNEVISYFVNYNSKIRSGFKADFYHFVITECSMVYVALNTVEEAFQFFDSQNARGKSLEAYDLLKAYHLRSTKNERKEDVLSCVEKWEKAVSPQDGKANLDLIISQILFRLRQWDLGKDGEVFENKDIDIFKGVEKETTYPYLTSQKAGLALFTQSQQNPFMYKDEYQNPPFNIQQTMINGRTFFLFVEHYRDLHYLLFNYQNGVLLKYPFGNQDGNIIKFIEIYNGSDRTGDRYVQSLFKSAVFAYYDKFGEDGLDIAIERAFRWAFRLRLIHQSVRFRTIENAAQDRNGFLSVVVKAKLPQDIARYIPPRVEKLACTKCDEIISFLGVKNESE